MTKRLNWEYTAKKKLNQALVRAFIIPLSAITYDIKSVTEIDIVVRAHNRNKKDEIIEQMTAFEEECARSFSNDLNLDEFRIGRATIVPEPLREGLPAERKTRNYDAYMLLWHYNQYAAAWRKFNTWKAAQLSMLYEHTIDYPAQPFSTFWPLLYGLQPMPPEIREIILRDSSLSNDLTDKNNIQQMRHYLWETNKEFALKEFEHRHYLRENEAALNFAAEYDVRYDCLGNVSRALQEIQRMWHEDERLECYERVSYEKITRWATRNVQVNVKLRGFDWPSIPEIKARLRIHAQERKRKDELTKIMRDLQGRVDALG